MKIDLNYSGILKDIMHDVDNFANATISDMAMTVRDELTEAAHNAMINFYKHYTPMFYERNGDFNGNKGFLNTGYKPYYINKHRSTARGGVEIPGDVKGYYRYDINKISDFVWAGFHGPPIGHNVNTPVMSPSPMEMVLKRRQEIIDNELPWIKAKAIAKAKKRKYTYIYQ